MQLFGCVILASRTLITAVPLDKALEKPAAIELKDQQSLPLLVNHYTDYADDSYYAGEDNILSSEEDFDDRGSRLSQTGFPNDRRLGAPDIKIDLEIDSEDSDPECDASEKDQFLEKCEPGFRYDAEKDWCMDIDECLEQVHNCGEDQFCVNWDGTYSCVFDDCEQEESKSFLYCPEKNTVDRGGVCVCVKGTREEYEEIRGIRVLNCVEGDKQT